MQASLEKSDGIRYRKCVNVEQSMRFAGRQLQGEKNLIGLKRGAVKEGVFILSLVVNSLKADS